MAISFLMIMIAMAVTLAYILLIRSNDNDEENSTNDNYIINNGVCFIPTINKNDGESQEDFETRLLELMKSYGFDDKGPYNGNDYNSEYYIAGLAHHASDPFVSFGVATRDRHNRYSSRAVAIVTHQKKLVGYVPEKALDRWYEDTEGEDTPVIIFCYRSNGSLIGSIYTYNQNAADYKRMVNKYLKCLKMHS